MPNLQVNYRKVAGFFHVDVRWSCLSLRAKHPVCREEPCGFPHQLCITSIPVTDRHTSVSMESTTEELGQLSQRDAPLGEGWNHCGERACDPHSELWRQWDRRYVIHCSAFARPIKKKWRTRCVLRKQLRPKMPSRDASGMVQVARDAVKLESVQAEVARAVAINGIYGRQRTVSGLRLRSTMEGTTEQVHPATSATGDPFGLGSVSLLTLCDLLQRPAHTTPTRRTRFNNAA